MQRTWLAVAIATVGVVLSLAASLGRVGHNAGEASARNGSSIGLLVPAAAMSAPRAAHSATLPDGRVLVAGGFSEEGSARGAELYESVSGRFTALPPMITTRHSHSATLLPDGKVLIAGGYGEGTATLSTAEVFDPATNSFASTGSLLAARAGHADREGQAAVVCPG